MQGAPQLGARATQGAHRILELRRAVRAAAVIARIPVLVGRVALGAATLHEAVSQEHARLGVEQLRDLALDDEAIFAERAPDFRAVLAIPRRVRAAVVIERDLEAGKVTLMRDAHVTDHVLFGTPFLA